MSSKANEFEKKAEECEKNANASSNPEIRQDLSSLARQWRELAKARQGAE